MDVSSSTADTDFLTIREVCDDLGVTFVRYASMKVGASHAETEAETPVLLHGGCRGLRAIMTLKSVGLSLREIREVLQSPGDGPYGLNATLCEKVFKRLSVQRADAEAGLAFLADAGCRCRAPERRA